jgi:hypothetical protein
MISFNVCQEEFIMPLSIDSNNTTIFELKATISGMLNVEYNDINIMLESVGNLDDENMSELVLSDLGLSK